MQPEAFLTHQVFEKLEQLSNVLSVVENRESIPIDNLVFFETFYDYCKERLRLTIPVLVQEPDLTSLSSEIENGTSQIITYLGNNNTGHLNNAVNNFNSALNRTRNFSFPLSQDKFDFSKHAASFQTTLLNAYNKLERYTHNIKQDLNDTEKDIGEKRSELKELSNKLAETDIETDELIGQYKLEFEKIMAKANASIEADRKKYTEEVESDRKTFTELINDDKKIFQEEFEKQIKESDFMLKTHLSKIEGKLEEAKKIVNIIGNVGITGNYQIIANQHRKTANWLRGLAFFFMALMSGLLVWSIIELGGKEFDLYKSLVRILAAAVLTYPAIYASRESTRHRNLETRNRNLELELASVGPFIELLPQIEQQKIKQELVKKYFGNHLSDEGDKKTGDEDVSVNALDKLLKTILPFMKK